MMRSFSIGFVLLLAFSVQCLANEQSGLATFAAGRTTVEALFEASSKIVVSEGFPITFSDQAKGELEASVTRYNTFSAGQSGTRKDVSFWRISFKVLPDGNIQMTMARGSDLLLVNEIPRLLGNLASMVRIDPASIDLTLNGETRPLPKWK